MASIYDYETGNVLSEGLQGCTVCSEAMRAAQNWADRRGASVELCDDDGRWLVHAASEDGTREDADFLGEIQRDPESLP
jgi:hypothetical protein